MPTADRLVEALKAEHFDQKVTPELEAAIAAVGSRALSSLGVDMAFNMRNPLTKEYLNGWREVKLKGINRTTSDAIRARIEKAQQAGGGIEDMVQEIGAYFDDVSGARAELIARTEAVSSANGANLAAWQLSGIVENKEWLSALGQQQPRPDHQAMNGVVAKISDNFTLPNGATASAPGQFGDASEDCNCFVAETSVVAPSLAEKAFRRRYSGNLVTLETASGTRLSGTPNHPILTPRGWVALGMLNEGDEVFECVSSKTGSSAPNNVDDVPPSFEKVFNLASVSCVSSRVALGDVKQFHGDGTASDVDVVSIHGELGNALQASGFESLHKFDLSSPDLTQRALSGDGALAHRGGAWVTTSDCIVSPASVGETLIGGQASHSVSLPVGAIANADAAPDEVAQDARPRDTEASGQSKETLPANVSRSRIVKLSVTEFSGHVFNLQTSGEWYLANGIIAHNCHCTILPKLDEKAAPVDKVAVWRAFMDDVNETDARLLKAVRAAFAAQRADCLAALKG